MNEQLRNRKVLTETAQADRDIYEARIEGLYPNGNAYKRLRRHHPGSPLLQEADPTCWEDGDPDE